MNVQSNMYLDFKEDIYPHNIRNVLDSSLGPISDTFRNTYHRRNRNNSLAYRRNYPLKC